MVLSLLHSAIAVTLCGVTSTLINNFKRLLLFYAVTRGLTGGAGVCSAL